MKEVNIKDPTDCPYYLIYRVNLLTTSALKKELLKAGIDNVKPAYLSTLMSLWSEENMDDTLGRFGTSGGLKLNELGRRAGLEPSSMTGLIDRMERDNLVMRTSDPNDRRAHLITLTDEGRKIQQTVMETVNNTLDRVFEGINEEDVEQTKSFLSKVLGNVNKGDF